MVSSRRLLHRSRDRQLESYLDITVDSVVADLTPDLSSVLDELLVDSADEIADGVIRFRITDADQNLDTRRFRSSTAASKAAPPGQPGQLHTQASIPGIRNTQRATTAGLWSSCR